MYSKQFWMFCVMLLVITLISSIGGGIRYRENFLEEVFDLNDITAELSETNNYYTPVFEETVEEIAQKPHTIKIEEEQPIQLPEISGTGNPIDNVYEIIEPYTSSGSYAAFR